MESCFEKDWSYSKITKMINSKKKLNTLKEFLKSNYKLIKDFYKTKSSYSGMHIFGIGAN